MTGRLTESATGCPKVGQVGWLGYVFGLVFVCGLGYMGAVVDRVLEGLVGLAFGPCSLQKPLLHESDANFTNRGGRT